MLDNKRNIHRRNGTRTRKSTDHVTEKKIAQGREAMKKAREMTKIERRIKKRIKTKEPKKKDRNGYVAV